MTSRLRDAALLLSLSMLCAFEAEAQDCVLKRYASLDLSLDEGGVLVPVTVNGHAGHMRLYVAWPMSAFYGDAARTMELVFRNSVRDLEIDFGTERVRQTAKFDSLVLGTANVAKGEFMVLPDAFSDTAALGILGMDVFARIDFELDLRQRKLNLFSQDHCPGQVVYWSDSFASTPLNKEPGSFGSLYFEMELDGKTLEATLSPSRPTTAVSTEVIKRVFGFDETSPGVEIERDGDSGEARRHFLAMQLTAPGLTVTNTRIELLPPAECGDRQPATGTRITDECRSAHPLVLGRNILEQLRLYFATKERVLYYTAAEAF